MDCNSSYLGNMKKIISIQFLFKSEYFIPFIVNTSCFQAGYLTWADIKQTQRYKHTRGRKPSQQLEQTGEESDTATVIDEAVSLRGSQKLWTLFLPLQVISLLIFLHYSHWKFTLLLLSILKASLGHNEQHYLFIINDAHLKVDFCISNTTDQIFQANKSLFQVIPKTKLSLISFLETQARSLPVLGHLEWLRLADTCKLGVQWELISEERQ